MTYSKPMKKLRVANRAQMAMVTVDVERLVGEEHAARAIWELTGQFDLSLFAEPIQSAAGEAGRPAWDPRLLVSVWLYAYSQGIGSAREIERQMAYEPGLEWLCGLEVINHHTLSDFRVQHGAALDELFVQMLAVLDQTGAIGLERVMHDGTKVKAQASGGSFRREKTLRERLEQARQLVAELKAVETEGESRTRQQAACERAARERVGRLEEALTELEREKRRTRSRVKDKRVSVSDPESRVMKQSDGGFAPSYNVQISTDARASVVVGVGVSQEASDHGELMPALERVVRNLGTQPRQVVADGGYATRDNIARTGEAGMELIAPVRDATAKSAGALRRAGIDVAFGPSSFQHDPKSNTLVCPAGKRLRYRTVNRKHGVLYKIYEAHGKDCRSCAHRRRCCPQERDRGRRVSIHPPEPWVVAHQQRMSTEQARAVYRQRGQVAEFPHAWIKTKIGLRQFRLRGLAKVKLEALWACLTYNVMQWVRLVWRPALTPA